MKKQKFNIVLPFSATVHVSEMPKAGDTLNTNVGKVEVFDVDDDGKVTVRRIHDNTRIHSGWVYKG
jgi:hypothetical protein